MKKTFVRSLIVVLALAIIVLLAAFTNQDASSSALTTNVSDYSLDWHNEVEDLPVGIHNICAVDCFNRNFAEWIRLGAPTNTATIEVNNVIEAQAYAGADNQGFFYGPLTTSINGDFVTVELPEGQTSFLLWVTTNNNDPFGIVDR